MNASNKNKMNKLSRNNLQEFCRVCLTYLPKRCKVPRNTSSRRLRNDTRLKENGYDLSFLPQLRELFVLLTSMDAPKENEEDVYPRSLCQSCYDKMIDFRDFRNLAINSAGLLHKIVNNDSNNDEVERICQQTGSVQKFMKPLIALSFPGDEDDTLLLPELVPLMESSIKAEPQDYNKLIDFSSDLTQPIDGRADIDERFVKNEIASECEENDIDPPLKEGNASGTFYNSINDVSEEHTMQDENGDVNTFNLQKENEADNGDLIQSSPTRKRDRNNTMLQCPFCAKQARRQVYLDAHIRGVHDGHEKPFLCGECESSFTRYAQLRLHRIKTKHFVEKKFICGINGCDASFILNKTLKTHRRVVHTSSALFGFEEMLELHQLQLHENGNGPWTCQVCLKNYSSKHSLSVHEQRHTKFNSHICKVCGVGKVTRRELNIHMRTHTPNLEKFKCSLCPQEFTHKNAISRHVRVVHEGQRRYPCSYCPKRFGTRNSQVGHERLHTGERPFTCNTCNKSFSQIEALKSHMKNHDETLRTHVCSFCSQRFITKKNLIDHEKRHQGSKPHICNICSRGFFSVVDLDAHKQSHTEEEKNRAEIKRGGLKTSQEHLHNSDEEMEKRKDESSNDRSSSMSIN